VTDRIEYMCPHCGWRFDALLARECNLVPRHAYPPTPVGGRLCPGSEQGPRNPDSDRRPLWKDLPGAREPTDHERRPFTLTVDRLRACLLRLASRDYSAADVRAHVADALGLTLAELDEELR
jgi:hypothetical protein